MGNYTELVEKTLEEKKGYWKCTKCGSKTASQPGEQKGTCSNCGQDTRLKTMEGKKEETITEGLSDDDKKKLRDFIRNLKGIDDSKFHDFAEENNFNVHSAEAYMYELAQEYLKTVKKD